MYTHAWSRSASATPTSRFTLQTYSHVMPTMHDEAAERVAGVLFSDRYDSATGGLST